VIYLDASAIVKMAHVEEHSDALAEWLDAWPDRAKTSSVLIEVEVVRALRRDDPTALPSAARIVDGLELIDLSEAVRSTAAAFPRPTLRSLDAIHLASARFLATTTGVAPTFVAYDVRLLAAAREDGFEVAAPGVETA
jgi:uncharacterized protein